MSELRDPTRESLAETVRALVKRHGGPTEVGDAVGAHRLTVNRWMKGDIGIDKLGLLAEKLEEPITVRFGPGHEETPPEPVWLEGLEDRIAERLEARLIGKESIPDRVAERIATRLGLPRPPSDEADAEASGAPVDTASTERQPKG